MRSHDERLQLLKRFETECCGDRTATEVAASLGVPISTMWRWRRHAHALRRKKAERTVEPVDVAIECLCKTGGSSLADLLRAVSAFMIWLRWPSDFEKYDQGLTACVLAYLSDKFGDIKIGQLPMPEREIACQLISVGSVAGICSWNLESVPWFSLSNIDGQKFTELDAIAELARFFLVFEGKGRYKNPSFEKAYYASHAWESKFSKWRISMSSFRILYKDHFASAAFLFTERFAPGLEWTLDPFDPGFSEDIDKVINDLDGRRLFFAKSFIVQQRIIERMDKRAHKSLRFPQCPPTLRAMVEDGALCREIDELAEMERSRIVTNLSQNNQLK